MFEKNVLQMLSKIDDKLDAQSQEISNIKVAYAELPCGRYNNRISLLERIIFTFIGVIFAALVVTIIKYAFDNSSYNVAKHQITQEVIKELKKQSK